MGQNKAVIQRSWCLRYCEPGDTTDRLVAFGPNEKEMRAAAQRLNDKLNERHGIPEKVPFAFYFVARGFDVLPGMAAYGRLLDAEAEECLAPEGDSL